jgi:hypothetical protein
MYAALTVCLLTLFFCIDIDCACMMMLCVFWPSDQPCHHRFVLQDSTALLG